MVAWEANGDVYDDFRPLAVDTLLSGRTSDSGHTWAQYHVTWKIYDPGHDSVGNIARGEGGERGRIGIDFGTADVDVECVLEDDGTGSLEAGLMLRRTAAGYYTVAFFAGQVSIAKITEFSVETGLATYTGLSGGELGVLRAVASGNDITAYWNGVELGTVTDSTYSGTVHGLWQRFGGVNNSHAFYAFNMHPVRTRGWKVGAI